MLGGNWNAATAKDGLGERRGVLRHAARARAARPSPIGSTSVPMHISAKTKQPDLAAAYLDFITGPTAGQALVDTQQVPAATDATAKPGDPLGQEVKDGLGQARQGRRPDAVSRLVVADDAADDGPDLPGDAGRAGSRRRTSSRASRRTGRSTTRSSRGS